MRYDKHGRARLRERQKEERAKKARVLRAGEHVYMGSSCNILARRVPVGKPSFKWDWRWQTHLSVLAKQRVRG